MDAACSSQHRLPVVVAFLPWSKCSHNLVYDSSEEKNPRLILYNEKDEVVKVSWGRGADSCQQVLRLLHLVSDRPSVPQRRSEKEKCIKWGVFSVLKDLNTVCPVHLPQTLFISGPVGTVRLSSNEFPQWWPKWTKEPLQQWFSCFYFPIKRECGSFPLVSFSHWYLLFSFMDFIMQAPCETELLNKWMCWRSAAKFVS